MAEDPEKRFERAMQRLFSTDRSSASCPATPATSSARVSSPAREKNAVTSAAAEIREQRKTRVQTPSPNSRSLCRPWDRGDVLRRLATFKSMTWFGKPQVAGPVACARRGWINVDVDLLACEVCGAHLSFVLPPAPWSRAQADSSAEVFAEQLDSGHKPLCAWKGNACSESLSLFPPTPVAALVGGFHDCCEGLLKLAALPVISASAIDTFKLLRGPQTESLLSQPPPLKGSGFQYGNELEASGAESGDRSENGYSYDGFYQAQRLIALCGWEPRLLPYTVDCVEGPAPSSKSKISQSGDAIVSRESRDPGPSVLLVSRGGKEEEKTEIGHNKETKCDPASAVLECSLCRASVGLWSFSTIPRPPSLLDAAIADVPQPAQNLTDADVGGVNAASAVDGGSRQGNSVKDTVELCEASDEDAITTPACVVRTSVPRALNLSLTIAGGPPPTQLNSPAMIPPAFGPIAGFLPRIGQPERSEVGDFVASYESRGSRDHDTGVQLGGSTIDTMNNRLFPADSTAEGTVVDQGENEGDNDRGAGPLKWRVNTENSAVDQLSQGAVLTSGNANVIPEVDTEVRGARRKRRRTTEATGQVTGPSNHLPGVRDLLPCSSSVNAIDTHYLQKQENSMESVDNQFQDSDGHETTAVSAENDVNDQVEGTETVGQAEQSGARDAVSGRSVQRVEPGLSKSDEVECADDGVETNVAVISTGTGVAGGTSVGMGGGSVGTQGSHEVEMQGEVNGADFSVHRSDIIPGDIEFVPESLEYQGLMGEFVPDRGLMGESIPEDEEKAGPSDVRGDSHEVMLALRPGKRLKTKGTVESESGKGSGKRVYDQYDDQTVDTTKAVIVYSESGQEKEATDGHTATATGVEEGHTVNGPSRGLDEFRMWETETGEFDPIRQHRHFCPWVNGSVAAAANSSSSQAGICGWELSLDALFAQDQQGGTTPDLATSTRSTYKANSLVSGRKLLGTSASSYLGRRTLF